MRILFATYSLAFQNPGGGERVLLALRRELEARGHEVDLFDPWRQDLSRYDVIHYFSCLETSFWWHARRQAPRTPLVVTPTLNWPDERLRRWSIRAKTGALSLLERLTPGSRARWGHLRLPELWLPTTPWEARGLSQCWGIPPRRIRVLPNGVEDRFFTANAAPFHDRFRIPGPFVLHVGRFHPVKNQIRLIEAVRLIRGQCVFIGDAGPEHEQYYRDCLRLAEEARATDPSGATRFHFIPALSQDDPALPSAYAAASVFALPSEFETFGIAALEAAVAGTPLLLTRRMRSRDVFEGFAEFVDPTDTVALASELRKALDRGAPAMSEEKARRAVLLDRYRWERIAGELVGIYQTGPLPC